MNRALRVAWPALSIVVALATAVTVTVGVSGGASALLVVRAGALVLLQLAAAAVLGAVIAAGAERDAAPRGRLLDLAAGGAAAWTVVAAATGFLLYLEQAPAADSPSFGPGLVTFLFEVEIGRGWLIAAALAAVLTALLIAVRSRRGTVGLGIASVVTTVPVALQSAMSGDALDVHRAVVSAGLVQLVAVGTWAGVVVLRRTKAIPVLALGALAVAIAGTSPALVADGAVTAVAVAGGIAMTVAGVLALAGLASRADLRIPQLVLLGIAIGLGAAASVTRSMPDVPARATPAEILTGSPLPQQPSPGALMASWRPDAVWLVVAVALLAGYLVVARRAGASWPPVRTASWVVGVVLLAWLTSGGPAVYAPVLVAAELARLVTLLLVVPLLLAGGAPLRLLGATLPSRRMPTFPARPVPTILLVVVAAALLIGTPLLRWSLTDVVGSEVAIGAALLLGGLLVHSVGAAGARRRSSIVVVIVLLAVEVAAGVLLAVSGGLLVADWYGAMGWGTDALAAQRAAAVLVLPLAVVPTAVLLVAALRSPASARLARPEAVVA